MSSASEPGTSKNGPAVPGRRPIRLPWNQFTLWLIVSLLTSGIPATAEAAWRKWITDVTSLGFPELFAMTAPLVWSIALVTLAWKRNWLDQTGGPYVAGAIILAGAWIGQQLGHSGAAEPVALLPTDRYGLLGQLVFAAVNQCLGYLRAYGPAATVASVLVGWTLGNTWDRVLEKTALSMPGSTRPSFNPERSDAEGVASSRPARRRDAA